MKTKMEVGGGLLETQPTTALEDVTIAPSLPSSMTEGPAPEEGEEQSYWTG